MKGQGKAVEGKAVEGQGKAVLTEVGVIGLVEPFEVRGVEGQISWEGVCTEHLGQHASLGPPVGEGVASKDPPGS